MALRRHKAKEQADNPEKEMSVSGHLKELRNRIVICLLVFLVATVIAIAYSPNIVSFLLEMGTAYGYEYIYISPQELLMQYFSVSIIVGVLVAMPVILYHIWAFIQPGLKENENRFFLFSMIFGVICFCIGVYFAYRVMLPFMLEFLISVNTTATEITASITVEKYINFLTTIFIIFGVVFELPMLSILLTNFGLMKPEWMKKGRKVAIVIIFLIAAVVTPPDIVSQVMVAVPMICLYQISIYLSALVIKLKGKNADPEDEDDLEI